VTESAEWKKGAMKRSNRMENVGKIYDGAVSSLFTIVSSLYTNFTIVDTVLLHIQTIQ
jgi:hypothetical protein